MTYDRVFNKAGHLLSTFTSARNYFKLNQLSAWVGVGLGLGGRGGWGEPKVSPRELGPEIILTFLSASIQLNDELSCYTYSFMLG